MNSSAAIAATHPASARAAGSSPHVIRTLLLGAIRRVAAARARARTRKVLRSLDDYALKDIGLVRDQIDCVEHDPRYGTRFVRIM